MSLNGKYRDLYQTLLLTIPEDRLITKEISRFALGTDAGLFRLTPKLVVKVNSELEVQQVLNSCNKFNIPLTYRASGTSVSGQAISDSVLVMLGKGWNRCDIFNNGDQIDLGVGVIGGVANKALEPYGKKLGPDPASIQSARIGGIVANNSSGMTCGVLKNTQNTLKGIRLILTDGTLLDTRDPSSCGRFLKSHSTFVNQLQAIAARINANDPIRDKIKKKYQIKNTTGYSINALTDYSDPIEMIEHLMVGSEGSLGFISEVSFATVDDPPFKASSLITFASINTACEALKILKGCEVAAAELMDRRTIATLEDLPEIPDYFKTLELDAAVLLVEVRANSKSALNTLVDQTKTALESISTVVPVQFFYDEEQCRKLWEIREGFDPIICAKSPPGTIMVTEDIALPGDSLAEAIGDFHKLFDRYGYHEAVVFGHALAGNLHFVFLQDFNSEAEIQRYQNFVDELVHIVVDQYNGSLKAEHGTGRSMAAFVEKEWGTEIYEIMKEIKELFDPNQILNPDVIISNDPEIHVKNLKTFLPIDPIIDHCIECGFCERMCVSNGLTLSARQRIVVLREIRSLSNSGKNPERLKLLKRDYAYFVINTCAADGLCAQACPSEIDTGKYIKKLRSIESGLLKQKTGAWIGDHMSFVTTSGRAMLGLVQTISSVFGDAFLEKSSSVFRKLTNGKTPRWSSHFPNPQKHRYFNSSQSNSNSVKEVVYFPSCINRTMGADPKSPQQESLISVTERLIKKAGFSVRYPEQIESLCCGLSFDSKGLKEAAEKRSSEMENALMTASDGGRIPILCDMSPCLLHMKETLVKELKLYEPIEFALNHLIPNLQIQKQSGTIVLHATCSAKKMELSAGLITLAQHCVEKVILLDTNCCGFAGDKGFFVPDLNQHGLRTIAAQIPQSVTKGYSTSRTCEIGLTEKGNIPFQSIFYLLDEVSN